MYEHKTYLVRKDLFKELANRIRNDLTQKMKYILRRRITQLLLEVLWYRDQRYAF